MYLLIIAVSVTFLLLGSYFDLRTGEIPEKISYGFILSILVISAIDSAFDSNIKFLLNSILIGIAFFMISFVLFYLGQWGGGDVKLMGGIGCSLGYLASANYINSGFFPYYLTYFINMGFVALPYATLYCLILGVKNSSTRNEFRKYIGDVRTKLVFLLSFLPGTFAFFMGQNPLAIFYTLSLPSLMISALYLKAVEMTILQRRVDVSELREGDLVADDLIVDNENIASRRNIEGLDNENILKIQKLAVEGKIDNKIKIKEGIRFAPILMITFLSVIWIGNFMEIIMSILINSM